MFINSREDVGNRVLIGLIAITKELSLKIYTIVHSLGIMIGIIHKRQFTTSQDIHTQLRLRIGIGNNIFL